MGYSNTGRNLALIYRSFYDPVMWLVGRNAPIDLHNFSDSWQEKSDSTQSLKTPKNCQQDI